MKKFERVMYIILLLLLTAINIISRISEKRQVDENNQNFASFSAGNNHIRQMEFESTDFHLNSFNKLVSVNHDTVLLNKFFDHPRLVLFMHEQSCQPCMDSVFSCISEVFGLDTNCLTIISSRSGAKQILLNNKYHNISFPSYYLDVDNVEISALNQSISFLCIIDEYLETKNVFIPSNVSSNQTRWYLNFVRLKYLNRKHMVPGS